LLLDWLLLENEELELCKHDNTSLITIIEQDGFVKCKKNIRKEKDEKIFYGIRDAFYRCGLLLPSNWEEIAKKLSEFDDVILGVDTNALHKCTISEHLLPALSLIDPKEYVHTPNWILFVIPSAVMHEIEEAANIRSNNLLRFEGRMGFRALQEIIELSQSTDITGISLVIVGEADPVLDTRVELQGLREDLCKRERQHFDFLEPTYFPFRSLKRSSGDMIIRDQFKKFLRQIDFHKGIYFLTNDKSNAALARTEGLHPIYFRSPSRYYEDQSEITPYRLHAPNEEIIMNVLLGKLIYEMTVQFGSIKVKWKDGEITLQCDLKGETLDYWIQRKLLIKEDDLKNISKCYKGTFKLDKVIYVWNNLIKNFMGVEEG